MKQIKNRPLVNMLILIGLVLALIGCRTAWIDLPISGSFPGTMDESLSIRSAIGIFRSAFLPTFLLAGLCGLLGYRLISMQISFVGLLILMGFVAYSLFHEHQWLVTYIAQSAERLSLQNFITKFYWPNINPDYTVVLTSKYEYLWDRLILNLDIIGVGLKVAFAGVITLLLAGAIQKPITTKFNLIAGLVLIVGILAVLGPLARANYIHHQGDTYFSENNFDDAFSAYETAFELDPMLGYSAPFLIKVSHLYYQLEGEYSVYSGLYMLNATARQGKINVISPDFLKQLSSIRMTIENNLQMAGNANSLQKALLSQIATLDANLWAQQGRLEYARGLYEESIISFSHALNNESDNAHVQFVMADVLSKLNRNEESLVFLKSALDKVWTSQLRADLLCTIGDVYEKLEKPLLARESYTSCYELDSVYNYRAVKNLGGT